MKPTLQIALGIAPLLLGLAAPISAQQMTGCTPDSIAAPPEPDLVIRAEARADRLRFDSDPQISVDLSGCSALDSVRVIQRTNLPERIEPGVTYEDVTVAVEIVGHLDIECLLDPQATLPDSAVAELRRSLQSSCAPAAADPAAPRQ